MTDELKEIVNRETSAWNTQDIHLLLSIFHPDMVWVWPLNNHAHNPIDWEAPQGKFDYKRWYQIYSDMFSSFTLEHNKRAIIKIVTTAEQDGGFAVVDIDTLWKNKRNGEAMHWLGRTCKTYVKTGDGELKMIAQTGVLSYD